MKIAVDGPGGAGKSTLSKRLAARFGFVYIDTGAMYRAAGLACVQKGVMIKEQMQEAIDVVNASEIDLIPSENGQRILLNGEDVTGLIRTPEISMAASDVSAIPQVRIRLVEMQRKLAETKDVIMDGRDIGTYVLPDAPIKIFLTASAEERARRRYLELTARGEDCSFENVLAELLQRDKNDSTRAFSPLKQAPDSILVDTTELNFEQSFEQLVKIIEERL